MFEKIPTMKRIITLVLLSFLSYCSYAQKADSTHAVHHVTHATTIHHYKNHEGHTVQSPTYYDKAPEGATAVCGDGTYSYSESHRGTCSHHGGVRKWL
jgi:hypothetical protein